MSSLKDEQPCMNTGGGFQSSMWTMKQHGTTGIVIYKDGVLFGDWPDKPEASPQEREDAEKFAHDFIRHQTGDREPENIPSVAY